VAVTSDTPVPTTEGWVRAHALTTKHVVFDVEGNPQPVKGVQLYIPAECYEASFHDGVAVRGDRHMSFELQDKTWRDRRGSWAKNRGKKGARKSMRRPLKKKSVHELSRESLAREDGRREYSLPVTSPVKYSWVDLPVPPYVVGVFLATLSPTGRHWLREKHDIKRMRARSREHGYSIVTRKHKNGDTLMEFRPPLATSFSVYGEGAPDSVPFSYMSASPEQREQLLDGFLDGYGSKKDLVEIVEHSWGRIRKLQGLVESLGYRSRLLKHETRGYFTLEFYKNREKPSNLYRFLSKINKITPKQCAHVLTERPFLVEEGFLAVC